MNNDKMLNYIEEFGLYFEKIGLTRMAGRVLVRLLICDPPEQSVNDLTEVLQAAKSSISTATRELEKFGFAERVSLPGKRRDYFRMRPDFGRRTIRDWLRRYADLRQLAEQGLELLKDTSPEQRRNLKEFRDMYFILEKQTQEMIETWKTV